MSNIIEFKIRSHSDSRSKAEDRPAVRDKSANEQEKINKRIVSLGGEAMENLGRWRTSIPVEDRTRLAKNMDTLIREYKIKPNKLAWGNYNYPDKESFHRDLSRMRMPETAEPGRSPSQRRSSKRTDRSRSASGSDRTGPCRSANTTEHPAQRDPTAGHSGRRW